MVKVGAWVKIRVSVEITIKIRARVWVRAGLGHQPLAKNQHAGCHRRRSRAFFSRELFFSAQSWARPGISVSRNNQNQNMECQS
jgi:hypothetical protein